MIHAGDLFDVLPTLAEASIDACVTDPPYGIGFMGREWDTFKPGVEQKRVVVNRQIASDNPNLKGRTRGPASSPSAVEYDRTLEGQRSFQVWTEKWAREVYRVLKPGAFIVVCGAPRSYHRMASGLEDAGFEIRDSALYWGFGQGFPKSLNVSKDGRFCPCAESKAEHGLRRVLDADLPTTVQPETTGDEVLLEGLSESSLPFADRAERAQGEQGRRESGMEGRLGARSVPACLPVASLRAKRRVQSALRNVEQRFTKPTLVVSAVPLHVVIIPREARLILTERGRVSANKELFS